MIKNGTSNAIGSVDTYLEKHNKFWKIKFVLMFRWPIKEMFYVIIGEGISFRFRANEDNS